MKSLSAAVAWEVDKICGHIFIALPFPFMSSLALYANPICQSTYSDEVENAVVTEYQAEGPACKHLLGVFATKTSRHAAIKHNSPIP